MWFFYLSGLGIFSSLLLTLVFATGGGMGFREWVVDAWPFWVFETVFSLLWIATARLLQNGDKRGAMLALVSFAWTWLSLLFGGRPSAFNAVVSIIGMAVIASIWKELRPDANI